MDWPFFDTGPHSRVLASPGGDEAADRERLMMTGPTVRRAPWKEPSMIIPRAVLGPDGTSELYAPACRIG